MGRVGFKIKKFANRVMSFFPSRLPQGMDALDKFILSILDTYDLPNKPSYFNAVATMVLHLPPTQHRASKRYFAKSIMKAIANEIAYGKIQDIKAADEEAKKNLECKQEPVSEPEE